METAAAGLMAVGLFMVAHMLWCIGYRTDTQLGRIAKALEERNDIERASRAPQPSTSPDRAG